MSAIKRPRIATPHIQEHFEAFKDTFRKASRIYRFLHESWKTNPLYLVRTLSYVNKHHVKPVRKRDNKIDSIARRLMSNQVREEARLRKLSNTNQQRSLALNRSKTICYYNWICNDKDKTSQKTKSYGFSCPWCEKDYGYLECLIMHLKCTHSRFNFNLVEEEGQPTIEITLNLSFDGSYCGFKYPGHDLRRDFTFTPSMPERRTSTTQLIHFKAKRRLSSVLESLAVHNGEVMNLEDEADVDVCSGRLYYHTSTCLPVKPNEGDIDSEADIDPEWLRERTQLMIDEFTDVNEGEKEILKLWNLHIMKNYKYKGDNMMRQACLDLVEMQGQTILSKNLFKNFTLHLANLYDFGLLGSRDVLECIRKLRSQLSSTH